MSLNPTLSANLRRLIASRNLQTLEGLVRKLPSEDLSHLMAGLPDSEALVVLQLLMDLNRANETLQTLPSLKIEHLLNLLPMEKKVALLREGSEEAAVHIAESMKQAARASLLEQLPESRRKALLSFLQYPEGSAGRIMHAHPFSVGQEMTAEGALRKIRERAKHGDTLYYIYCVDEHDHLVGVIPLRNLAMAEPQARIREIMIPNVVSVEPEATKEDLAQLVRQYHFLAYPVVDAEGHLLGHIPMEDMVDVIQARVTEELYAAAGLQKDDRVYSPLWDSVRFRAPWIFLNLGLAFVASLLLARFETSFHALILLAFFNNVVVSMGANTAIQTLTVVNRGLATGDFQEWSLASIFSKETLVGLILGLGTGLAAAVVVLIWKQSWTVAVAIFFALVLNSVVATTSGVLVPLALKKMRMDPAVASGAIVTTCTELFGFLSFLGIATLFLRAAGVSL